MLIVTMPNGTRFRMTQHRQRGDGEIVSVRLKTDKLLRNIERARRIEAKLVYRNAAGLFVDFRPEVRDG